MDPVKFLALPIDIRKEVYFFLGPDFCDVNGWSVASSSRKRRPQDLYAVFRPYLAIFNYMPKFVEQWLRCSCWLRYDCYVLDSLRINHAYQGSVFGPMDWIYLAGKARLSLFNAECLLQAWYTHGEYLRWIVEGDPTGEQDPHLPYTRLSLEHLPDGLAEKTWQYMQVKKLLGLIGEVWFQQDTEAEDGAVTFIIHHLEPIKNLQKITVSGETLFDRLVTFHGSRDNPGRSIGQQLKKRITDIELVDAVKTTTLQFTDLSRWDNLAHLHLSNVNVIDFNNFILPPKCTSITISKCQRLKWWDQNKEFEAIIASNAGNIFRRTGRSFLKLDKSVCAEDIVGKCQMLLWKSVHSINYIKLHDVSEIVGPRILIPNVFIENNRFIWTGFRSSISGDIIAI